MILQELENPMSAMTRDDGDHGDHGDLADPIPLLRELRETKRLYFKVQQQLPEVKSQFLEAKRRYRLFQRLVQLRRELFVRRFNRLQELARLRQLLRQGQEG